MSTALVFQLDSAMDQQQAFQAYANGIGFVQDEWEFSAGLTYQQNYNYLPMKSEYEYGDLEVQSVLQLNTLPQFDYASQTLSLPVGEHQNYCEEQMPNLADKGNQDEEQESPQQEGPTSEMEEFTKTLKSKRVSLGYTQADVGYALGVLYGKSFSQTTICRFESLQLSFKNMCKLKPILADWLNDLEKTDKLEKLINNGQEQPPPQKRKHRTSIETNVKERLENYFMNCTKPGAQEIAQIARELGMDKSVIRVWFCNRRQKGKRQLNPYLRENIGEHPDVVNSLSPPIEQHFSLPQFPTTQGFTASEIQYNHPVYMPGFHTNEVYPQNIPYGMPMAHYTN
ncbi:POU domain, class 5, transcription factor 1.2-like [Dendrobates tinctorius]|uniref:POU domain, class 5, transcription factor 1.2-like n=1 Tax=Dendrobates tinctorius TaxID=92724 RepID=UPI003CCA316A